MKDHRKLGGGKAPEANWGLIIIAVLTLVLWAVIIIIAL